MITLIITSQFAFILGIVFGICVYNSTINRIETKLKNKSIYLNHITEREKLMKKKKYMEMSRLEEITGRN